MDTDQDTDKDTDQDTDKDTARLGHDKARRVGCVSARRVGCVSAGRVRCVGCVGAGRVRSLSLDMSVFESFLALRRAGMTLVCDSARRELHCTQNDTSRHPKTLQKSQKSH